ncbi:hypothetical protein KAJ38_01265 [Candidatus Pacearchaeota archaeon]|nr:hypothetical protein [Candidatus Pacearchaeota archaeon]
MAYTDNPIEIHDELKEDIDLKGSEVAVIHGIVGGDVSVTGSSTLILHGIIRGNVTVGGQGTFFIHGIVYGDVTNNGGIIRHYGMIKGKLNKISGETIVNPKAIVCENEY